MEHREVQYVPRDDGRPCEEEDPDAVPALAVCGDDLVLVRDPVFIPSVNGGGVVHAKNIDAFDLEAGLLTLVNYPRDRAGSISAREDVFVHEETPEQEKGEHI